MLLALSISAFETTTVNADPLMEAFRNPPEATKPWCYWYWLNGDITKDGITKDLTAMAAVGINLAMIGNVTLNGKPGPVEMMSEEWFELTRHAMREGNRLGVDIYMFNGPGWSQSGGPWIKSEQSMRRVTWSEYPAMGGVFNKTVRPEEVLPGQDIAVLAVPRTQHISIKGTLVEDTVFFKHSEAFTARALLIDGDGEGTLFAIQDGKRELVANIQASRGNPKTDFLTGGMQNFSFRDTKASEFVFEFTPRIIKGTEPRPPEAVLTSEPKVTGVFEKQMARMHPTPAPTWESYIFQQSVEPEDASVLLQQNRILDLTNYLQSDGTLSCTLPDGKWTVLYFGMVPTGKKNHPAPPEATGYEVDKLSREHIRHHFKGQFAKLLDRLSPVERKAFRGITIDSYEVGAQNWTDGFAEAFERRYGYSPITLLPVFTGRVIDSAQISDQFLWDLRRTVADMISENYVGGLREIAHENDLRLWCENYGHWGFPGDFLSYGGQADELGGEFWTTANLGTTECRAASSAAHIYGKQRVYAEAFTSHLNLDDHPYSFKARGEELFTEGINHFVLHVYAHQPQDGIPGNNPWFGTAFHRNTPWFNKSHSWIRYLQRCHLMLQLGEPVADVLVYIGDFAPQMTGPKNPVSSGYDYDYIGSDAILRTLEVVDGEWVVFDEKSRQSIAARWKVLAMPKSMYMRPVVRERLDALVAKGGRTLESVNVSSNMLAEESIAPVITDASCGVRWKERKLDDGKLFFLSNFEKAGPFQATLRVSGMQPELLNPVTGEVTKLARYQSHAGTTSISIDVKDRSDSYFIIFREKITQPSVVEAWALPSELHLTYNDKGQLIAESSNKGKFFVSFSNGKKEELVFDRGSETLIIEGPWESQVGEGKQYSARFKTTFGLPADFGTGKRAILYLSDVETMAQVTLNGKSFDTLWMPPFEIDVTDALKSGQNALTVEITTKSTAKATVGKVHLHTKSRQVVDL